MGCQIFLSLQTGFFLLKKNIKKSRFPAAYVGKSLRNSTELQSYTSND